MHLPVSTFQNLMHLSLEPPPVANRFLCHGHQAKALTAALWPFKVCLSLPIAKSHIMAVLSLLPETNPFELSASPQTSPLWELSLPTMLFWDLTSCMSIWVSLEPEYRILEKESEETLFWWPVSVLTNALLYISYRSMEPSELPTDTRGVCGWKLMLHT
jgi:hypothetical protein